MLDHQDPQTLSLDVTPDGAVLAPAPHKAIALPTRKPQSRAGQFGGLDVCVDWYGDAQGLAQQMQSVCAIGDFHLSEISNGAAVVWPYCGAPTGEAAQWRCRFVAAEGASNVELEVPWLLSVIGERIRWTHIEKFELADDPGAASRAHSAAALVA